MSNNLDDNPFGDPFDNPFADPSVQRVQSSNVSNRNPMEDYNPFEHDQFVQQQQPQQPQQQQQQQQTTGITGGSQPPVVQVNSSQNFPQNQQTQQNSQQRPQISTEELQRRQEELDRKAAELDRREQQLAGNIPRLNNWPPLPERCCFQPCFYQDINVDIPSEFQRIVRNLYYAWGFYSLTMCLNILGGLFILFFHGTFTTFGLSIFYAFLFTPASYLCWFRPAYKAFRNDSSFNFMVFFLVYFVQTIISVFQTIGVPDTGYCGFILAIGQFSTHSVLGVLIGIYLIAVALCFGTCAFANVLLLTKVHAIYRSSGASMAKAQAEFTNEFMRNQHVQQAATSAMSSAVNSQMNNRY